MLDVVDKADCIRHKQNKTPYDIIVRKGVSQTVPVSWVDNILFHCGATLELNCDPDTESHKTQVCRLCDIKYNDNVLLLREAFKETKYDEHFI